MLNKKQAVFLFLKKIKLISIIDAVEIFIKLNVGWHILKFLFSGTHDINFSVFVEKSKLIRP